MSVSSQVFSSVTPDLREEENLGHSAPKRGPLIVIVSEDFVVPLGGVKVTSNDEGGVIELSCTVLDVDLASFVANIGNFFELGEGDLAAELLVVDDALSGVSLGPATPESGFGKVALVVSFAILLALDEVPSSGHSGLSSACRAIKDDHVCDGPGRGNKSAPLMESLSPRAIGEENLGFEGFMYDLVPGPGDWFGLDEVEDADLLGVGGRLLGLLAGVLGKLLSSSVPNLLIPGASIVKRFTPIETGVRLGAVVDTLLLAEMRLRIPGAGNVASVHSNAGPVEFLQDLIETKALVRNAPEVDMDVEFIGTGTDLELRGPFIDDFLPLNSEVRIGSEVLLVRLTDEEGDDALLAPRTVVGSLGSLCPETQLILNDRCCFGDLVDFIEDICGEVGKRIFAVRFEVPDRVLHKGGNLGRFDIVRIHVENL